ncbi:MAG: signal peptidase I [Desulfovibrionaceae bacterium]|nr:signal peptidase I [Desulfovibrionaceae bacterium]
MNPRWQKTLLEYIEALAVALVLALVIRTFVVQAFKIPSGSMLETLQIGDHLLVNKFLYGVKMPFTGSTLFDVEEPKHEDIIVFEFPEDPDKDFIKRIIGVPGDVIEIKDKEVYRNGEKLVEPYVRHTDPRITPRRDIFGPVTVPENKYFCMGDNRDESYDSRFWGFVDRDKIKGKAWVIYWSWNGIPNVRFDRIGMLVK